MYGTKYSRMNHVKLFKGCLPQITWFTLGYFIPVDYKLNIIYFDIFGPAFLFFALGGAVIESFSLRHL